MITTKNMLRFHGRIICFVFITLILLACKKEAGPGGKNTIAGKVSYKNGVTGNNDAAPMATVSIAYGTDQSSSSVNQTIVARGDGTYSFEGLRKGKYFVKAGFTDEHGFTYSTSGYGIVFENKKKTLELNIILE
jgi:hypothetical protein